MENDEFFREAELHFVYHQGRHLLLVQCFQEKLHLVKTRIDKLRSQLSTIVHPVKSPILTRYYSTSNQIKNIAGKTNRFTLSFHFLVLCRHIELYHYHRTTFGCDSYHWWTNDRFEDSRSITGKSSKINQRIRRTELFDTKNSSWRYSSLSRRRRKSTNDSIIIIIDFPL